MHTDEFQGVGTLAISLADSFIGIRKVCEISGFSKSTILRKIARNEFPGPIIREGNVTRWSLAECKAWQQDRLRERAQRQSIPASASQMQAP